MRQHDTPVAHLDSSGAAELKSGRELAPRRLCDLHRKTAHNSAARGGLVMDQRGRRRFEGVLSMPPRALLGASCESNGSKEKTLKSGVVGSRALAGQRLKQADFTFQDPSRGSGTTTHVPSADPRTLQLHLRDFPFSPPPPPLFAPLQARTKSDEGTKAAARAHYPSTYVLHTEVKSFNISQENIACFLGSYFEEQCTRVAVFERACVYMDSGKRGVEGGENGNSWRWSCRVRGSAEGACVVVPEPRGGYRKAKFACVSP